MVDGKLKDLPSAIQRIVARSIFPDRVFGNRLAITACEG